MLRRVRQRANGQVHQGVAGCLSFLSQWGQFFTGLVPFCGQLLRAGGLGVLIPDITGLKPRSRACAGPSAERRVPLLFGQAKFLHHWRERSRPCVQIPCRTVQTASHGKAKRVQHHFCRVASSVVNAQWIGLARTDVGHVFCTRALLWAVYGMVCLGFAYGQGKKVFLQQQLAASGLSATRGVFHSVSVGSLTKPTLRWSPAKRGSESGAFCNSHVV